MTATTSLLYALYDARYPKMGGHAYIAATVQHPYGESDEVRPVLWAQ
jgi:hypothetical protein